MNIIRSWSDKKPENYSGIIQLVNGTKIWYKNGKTHRENGPAWIDLNHFKRWTLEDNLIWNSDYKLDLTNQIILSKSQHPLYQTVQLWKILDKDRVWQQIVIPGMEELIKE